MVCLKDNFIFLSVGMSSVLKQKAEALQNYMRIIFIMPQVRIVAVIHRLEHGGR
jgi:hypothetical protein